MKQYTVITLSRPDIKQAGYTLTGASEAQIAGIAEIVQEQIMPDYWDALRDACDRAGLERA